MADELIINDSNFRKHIQPPKDKSTGLIPRDFTAFPVGIYKAAKPFMMPLIPRSEWEERLEYQKQGKAQISDIRNIGANGKQIPSLDQDGYGYCWAHSSVTACMLVRAVHNLPYIPLSAFAVACIIKNYHNQGGFCQESLDFISERGVPSQEYWPQGSTNRNNDNPETWANAALHITSEFQDHGHRNLDQLVTCLLSGIPVATDYNWWGHSVCTMDLVSVNPLRTRILNSWSDQWGDNGAGILEGDKCIPDNACSPRVMFASTE